MRLRHVAHVVVKPHLTVRQGAKVIAFLILFVGNQHDAGVVIGAFGPVLRPARPRAGGPEIRREGELLFLRQDLAGKDEDDVFQPQGINLPGRRGVERPAEIDPFDAGAECCAGGTDGVCHSEAPTSLKSLDPSYPNPVHCHQRGQGRVRSANVRQIGP